MGQQTTAQLRNLGYDAYQAGSYEEAARHYEAAIAAYPPHHPGSDLAKHDLAYLAARAKQARSAAEAMRA